MRNWVTAHYIDYQSGWEKKSKDRARWYSRHERMAHQHLSLPIPSILNWEVFPVEVSSWSRQTCLLRHRLLLQTGPCLRHQGQRRPDAGSHAMLHCHPVVDLMSTLLKENRKVESRITPRRGEGHHCLRHRKLDRHRRIPLVLHLGQRRLWASIVLSKPEGSHLYIRKLNPAKLLFFAAWEVSFQYGQVH